MMDMQTNNHKVLNPFQPYQCHRLSPTMIAMLIYHQTIMLPTPTVHHRRPVEILWYGPLWRSKYALFGFTPGDTGKKIKLFEIKSLSLENH
jgi:hypothetical protein